MADVPVQGFAYERAFIRNIGIVSGTEQERLRHATVAIAGLGGAGGIYALALARLGVGRFVLADGDGFEVANFNRQMGAMVSTVGRNKATTLAGQIRDINPEAAVTCFEAYVEAGNIDAFLAGADLVIDAIEMFAVPAHRLLLGAARQKGLSAIFAAPLGFSAALLVFSPGGMTADDYFDWKNGQSETEQLALFAIGVAPALLHVKDLDLRHVDLARRVGPSHIGACLLCAGIAATEATRILLDRPGRWAVPSFLQFDPYRQRLRTGVLRWGNRGPLQRFKKRLLLKRYLGSR